MSSNYYSPLSQQRAKSFDSRSLLGPELEARIDKILSKVPQHILENVKRQHSQFISSSPPKQSQFLKTYSGTGFSSGQTAASWHQRTPSLERLNESKKATQTEPYLSPDIFCCYPHNLKSSSLKTRSQVLELKVEEAVTRTQKLAKTATLASGQKSFTFPTNDFHVNYNDVNKRIIEAIGRTQQNIKKAGECLSYSSTNSSLGATARNFKSGSPSPKQSSLQGWNLNSARTESFLLSPNKKTISPTKASSQSNYHAYTIGNLSIDAKFDETLKRSQALRKVNEELFKKSHFLSKVFENGPEMINDNKYSTPRNYRAIDRTGGNRAREVKPFDPLLKHESGLHILQNAIMNLSPLNKLKTVDESYPDGSAYKGEKLRGKKHGRGVFKYPNGSKYDGEWANDARSGFGVKTFPNENIEYEGEWEADKYHGNGCLNNPNPRDIGYEAFDYKDFGELNGAWTLYQGEFNTGKWHGIGTLHLSNGEKFIGKFKDNIINGTGTFYKKSGANVIGEWRNNKFVESL